MNTAINTANSASTKLETAAILTWAIALLSICFVMAGMHYDNSLTSNLLF